MGKTIGKQKIKYQNDIYIYIIYTKSAGEEGALRYTQFNCLTWDVMLSGSASSITHNS